MTVGLKDRLARLGWSNEALTDARREQRSVESGCDRLIDCRDRQRVVVRGTIDVLTVRPRGDVPWLEADVNDGTGIITVVWMGRREIRGIEAGREIRIEGRISDVDDTRRVYNPRYELL